MSIDGAIVTVRGLDCLDGTPLLDLKPDRTLFTPVAPPQPGDFQVGDPQTDLRRCANRGCVTFAASGLGDGAAGMAAPLARAAAVAPDRLAMICSRSSLLKLAKPLTSSPAGMMPPT